MACSTRQEKRIGAGPPPKILLPVIGFNYSHRNRSSVSFILVSN
jgi:hypothetical protein